jgi:hypothetical protein
MGEAGLVGELLAEPRKHVLGTLPNRQRKKCDSLGPASPALAEIPCPAGGFAMVPPPQLERGTSRSTIYVSTPLFNDLALVNCKTRSWHTAGTACIAFV